MGTLLAVDLGLRTGLALYGSEGRLLWYRSQNFGTATRLRRAVHGLLDGLPDLRWLVLEGGGNLGEIWKREAARRHLAVEQIAAERWRQCLLYAREQRSGAQAKSHAGEFARRIIRWSDAPLPTSLRHDAAEAIAIGFWGVLQVGLLEEIPPELRR
jgi:hypothetical protein